MKAEQGDQHSVVLIIMTVVFVARTETLTFEGSKTSYAQYPRWDPCQNGSVAFEFKTSLPNGIIFYTDDGGRFDFFELNIIGGALRLRASLGEGVFTLTAGQSLDDDKWHNVEIKRNVHETILIVDKLTQTKRIRGKDLNFGSYSRNSNVFIGGLPVSFLTKLSSLSLPSVLFEPRFRGSVRNLMFKHCGQAETREQLISSDGIRLTDMDQCEEGNPCKNGGLCVSTDESATCDCSKTDFEGETCEKVKVPVIATFYGEQYVHYSTKHMDSSSEKLSLWFKTRRPSGMLFYSGDGSDYLNIALKDGAVVLAMNLGSGVYEVSVTPDDGARLDDNVWHELLVTREAREITIEVDGYSQSGSAIGSFRMLSSNVLYLGGSPHTAQLGGARIRSNFRGCMKKVTFQAESKKFNILEMTKDGVQFFSEHGALKYDACEDIIYTQPVSFVTPESYVRLPKWEAANDGTIEFTFQTNEKDGLVMFNNGVDTAADLFALEIIQGHLFLLLRLKSGLSKWQVTSVNVSDGLPHRVKLEHRGQIGSVLVDGENFNYRTKGRGDILNLSDMLYVGGLDMRHSRRHVPKELWSVSLGYGFVGCMEDLIVNGKRVDLAQIGREQGVSLADYCVTTESHCEPSPCMHAGVCSNGWNRFVCDCTLTGYIGTACDQAATTLTFDGRQYVEITLPQESHTEVEDITLRFKTKYSNSLLFTTFAKSLGDKMVLEIKRGVLHLSLNLGDGTKKMKVGRNLGDDKWHTCRISRRAHKLSLSVDNKWKTGKIHYDSSMYFVVSRLLIGSHSTSVTSDSVQGEANVMALRMMNVGGTLSDQGVKYSNFIGSMQQLIFNGNHLFEKASTGSLDSVDITAKFDSEKLPILSPVTFKSRESYVMLPKLAVHSTFTLYFQLRTLELNGLLLFNRGKSQDFFSLELVDGFIHYTFNIGDGARLLKSNNPLPLNDNSWHSIVILRPTLSQHILKVDLYSSMYEMHAESNSVHFDLEGELFVGGMPTSQYYALPSPVVSRTGFQGCMSSLELNGLKNDLLEGAIAINNKNLVMAGCEGKQNRCQEDSCDNMGECIERWDNFVCNCDMTSYTGPHCKDESIAYQFGDIPSVITFTFPRDGRPNVDTDHLALGFTTSQQNAVLVRVESYNSDDFIEMELLNGNIFVKYNMGNADHPIGEWFIPVNDEEYHVVRFTRSGPNSTIQVDDSNVQFKNPEGKQHGVFNEQSKIFIGGKFNKTDHISRPFRGTMAGLVFNELRLLDLVFQKDPRVKVHGNILKTDIKKRATDSVYPPDVQMEETTSSTALRSSTSSSFLQFTNETFVNHTSELSSTSSAVTMPTQSHPNISRLYSTSSEPTTTEVVTSDELIYITGSGCAEEDDEEQCSNHMSRTSDDLLIPTVTVTVHRTEPTHAEFPSSGPLAVTPRDGLITNITYDSTVSTDAGGLKPAVDVGTGGDRANDTNGGPAVTEIKKGSEAPSSVVLSDSNIALIVGISVALVVAIIILIVVVRKVKTKSAGSYKVDESKNYPVYEAGSKASSVINGGSIVKPSSPARGTEGQKKDVKEWYV